jgi:hypothetical protein
MTTHHVRILSITIATPLARAYQFAHQPGNFPKWAAGLSSSLHRAGDRWVAATPEGEAIVRFTEPNPYGVLDHWVRIGDRPEIYIPLRLIANGQGTEAELLLLRQPEMSDADFDRDADMVAKDLAALKAVLERDE